MEMILLIFKASWTLDATSGRSVARARSRTALRHEWWRFVRVPQSDDCARFVHPTRARWHHRRGHHGASTRYGAVPTDVADVVMHAWHHGPPSSWRILPFEPLLRTATPSPSCAHLSSRRSLCCLPLPLRSARLYGPPGASPPHHCPRTTNLRRFSYPVYTPSTVIPLLHDLIPVRCPCALDCMFSLDLTCSGSWCHATDVAHSLGVDFLYVAH